MTVAIEEAWDATASVDELLRQYRLTHFDEQPAGTFTLRQLMAARGLSEGGARDYVRREIAAGRMERAGEIGNGGRAGAHVVVYRFKEERLK